MKTLQIISMLIVMGILIILWVVKEITFLELTLTWTLIYSTLKNIEKNKIIKTLKNQS
jgi:hypothetical protein